LEYNSAVSPAAILVHETYNPGALTKVTGFTESGEEIALWKGTDPTPISNPRGISVLTIGKSFRTRRIKLYIDSPAVAGWNEIDAVGLRDGYGNVLWAKKAFASSSYGRNNVPYDPSNVFWLGRYVYGIF
jgi:hypothetical protein